MKQQFQTTNVIHFKRWSRKKYGVFLSMHNVVKVCTMSLSCSILVMPGKLAAQHAVPDSIMPGKNLPTVEIVDKEILLQGSLSPIHLNSSLQQKEIEKLPALSISELLEYLPGIDLRQRGSLNTQADVSYRGGSFDQTPVLINGINFSDPQTGHYTLNLPFCPTILQRIDLYKNTTSYLFGSGAFSGMVNVVALPQNNNYARLRLAGGMFGFWSIGADANVVAGRTKHLVSVTHEQSDGHRENTDFKSSQMYYHGNVEMHGGKLSWQTGYTDRSYGANGFYSLRFPKQHDHTQTLIGSLQWENNGKWKTIPSVYYRFNKDCFQLVKDQPKGRNNYHQTQVFGSNVKSYVDYTWGRTAWSGDIRAEDIISVNLGEPLFTPIAIGVEGLNYTNGRTRVHSGFSASQSFNYQRFGAAATLLLQHNTDLREKVYLLPAADIKYDFPTANIGNQQLQTQIVASAASSLRMPTFTDLYYRTGDVLGNKNLLPERAETVELSTDFALTSENTSRPYTKIKLNAYMRLGRNMIDYVKRDNDSIWRCINHSDINFAGTEVAFVLDPTAWNDHFFIRKFEIDYSFTQSSKESHGYLSRYVLDHPAHTLQFRLQHRIYGGFSMLWAVDYHKRQGDYQAFSNNNKLTPYPSYWLTNVRLSYDYKSWSAFVEALNLFDVKYFDYGELYQPGLWVRGGVNFTL